MTNYYLEAFPKNYTDTLLKMTISLKPKTKTRSKSKNKKFLHCESMPSAKMKSVNLTN